MGNPRDSEIDAGGAEGLRRVSLQLAAACRPCPERGAELAADCLCPCQVAVARRFLRAASETGPDPGLLDTEPRGALRLQVWAAGERPASCDLEVIRRELAELMRVHVACQLPGCLACEARAKLSGLLERAVAGVTG